MKKSDIHAVIRILRQEVVQWKTPAVTVVAEKSRNPFDVLISCLLSLRTKDETTASAFNRLQKRARTPRGILRIPVTVLAKIIYPVGFYNTKAKTLHGVCHSLIDRFDGKVPETIEELLTLKGVGRKTANLVVTLGHNKLGICVDTHVHRIPNRWNYIQTKTPEETETVLREILPKEYWIEFNDLLVCYGQNLCTPVSPKCSLCKLRPYCQRKGVTKSR